MPRPARQEVHRHFISLPAPSPSTAERASDTQNPDAGPDATVTETPDGKQPKHPRVQCKHCLWKSKRDASRQAKHLETCAPYRHWAEQNGEPVIGSEEALRVAVEERQARRRKSSMPSDADKANFFATPPSHRVDARQHPVQPSPDILPSSHYGPPLSLPPVMRPPSNPAHSSAVQGPTGTFGVGSSIQRLGDAEKRRLDLLYARALVAEGTDAEGKPHDLYDRQKHPQMWAFLKALNADYEPPSREVLGNMVMREFFGSNSGSPAVGGSSPALT